MLQNIRNRVFRKNSVSGFVLISGLYFTLFFELYHGIIKENEVERENDFNVMS